MLTRAKAHEFLNRLVEGRPPEEQAAMLREIMVEYWMFGGLEPSEIDGLARLELEVADLMGAGKKIEAIKRVREMTGMGLKESKDWVEGQLTDRQKIESVCTKDPKWTQLSRLSWINKPDEILKQLAAEYRLEWP